MRDDIDQPFGRRFYDRKDQRENGDDLTARFRECSTLREMYRVAVDVYRVPEDRALAIIHAPYSTAVRAMNLARQSRKWRFSPRRTSLGRTQGEPSPPRQRAWEVPEV